MNEADRRPEADDQADAEGRGWWHAGACLGRTSLFFATDDISQRIAVTVCGRCRVRSECRADVEATEDPRYRYGVVAGFTAAQRRTWPLALDIVSDARGRLSRVPVW